MKKQNIPLLLLLLLSLVSALLPGAQAWVRAEPSNQIETPPAAPTVLPTLNQALYLQTATPGLNGEIRHTVLPDQFLYHIVQLYGITLQDLLSMNNLTEDSPIYPGDQLVIVRGESTELGQGTLTPELALPEITPLPSPTAELLLRQALPENPEPTPTIETGFFQRVFSSNARFLALGVLALVLFGVILLVISSRRIQ